MRRSRHAIRGRWRWSPDLGRLVQVSGEQPRRQESAYVQPDLPEYISPASGQVVRGRRQRRDDFKRTGTRPYEGRESEERAARKVREEHERRLDQRCEEIAWRTWYEAPERVRKVFRGR